MAFARYYILRNSFEDPPSADQMTLTTAGTPWKWAMIRGANQHGAALANIALSGSSGVITLIVKVAAGNTVLAESEYELVIGDVNSKPNDPTFLPPGQARKPGDGIVVNTGKGFIAGVVLTTDPPPSPFKWAFGPIVSI